jgi:hypothetical protein
MSSITRQTQHQIPSLRQCSALVAIFASLFKIRSQLNRMLKITFLLVFSSSLSFGQNIYKGRIKPLSDTSNYIDNQIRTSIINYLKSEKIDPTKYFVDSAIEKRGDTLYISLLDSAGLKHLDEIDEQNKKNTKRQISINGDPGNFWTVLYDINRKKIIGRYFPQ